MIDIPVRVKDALRDGRLKKKYRFLVLNSDDTTDFVIDNDNLVSESVKIDERMCSGDTIKFGLCEGTSLEFQYFGLPSILNRHINCLLDVQYIAGDKSTQWYNGIPLGFFDVDQVSKQASTGIMKVIAYNKLKSDYLDAKANDLIIDAVNDGMIGRTGEAAISTILDKLLGDYSIERKYKSVSFSQINMVRAAVAQYKLNNSIYAYGYLGTYYDLYVNNFSQSKIYRVWMNCKKIIEKAREYLPDMLSDFSRALSVGEIYYQSSGSTGWSTRNVGIFSQKFLGTDAHPIPMYIMFTISDNGNTTQHKYYINGDNIDNESYFTEWVTNIISTYSSPQSTESARLYLPVYWKEITWNVGSSTAPYMLWTNQEIDAAQQRANELINGLEYLSIQEQDTSAMEDIMITLEEAKRLPDVTLRDLQSAVYETQCQFGRLDRVTDLFSGVELNKSRLYPQDALYPANDLYPDGAASSASRSSYSKLWANEGNIHKWRYLIIKYKSLDENDQEVEKTLQKTINAQGTDDYNMSDNWLFKNLVWDDEEVDAYADVMKAKMLNVTWFPFEMWAAGLPYLETGDEIEIPVNTSTYTSYILSRTLSGIQNLQDTYINGTLDIF